MDISQNLISFYQTRTWKAWDSITAIAQKFINHAGLKYSPQLLEDLKKILEPVFIPLERPQTHTHKPDYLVSFMTGYSAYGKNKRPY